jgi:tetratricopeptide (TPR) repeat protein
MNKSKVTYLNISKKPAVKPFYEKLWFKLPVRFILTIMYSIPPLSRYLEKTKPFLIGKISKLLKNEKYNEALDLSRSGLEKCDKKFEFDHLWWWEFMSYAVYCAQTLNDDKTMSKLFEMAENGFEPFEGRHYSYCYCYFSHFKYVEGDYDLAINLAERANKADDTFGDPFYLLGYYELFINDQDPLELFKAAIERDHSILNRIVNHPALKEFPNIIAKLKRLQIASPT